MKIIIVKECISCPYFGYTKEKTFPWVDYKYNKKYNGHCDLLERVCMPFNKIIEIKGIHANCPLLDCWG